MSFPPLLAQDKANHSHWGGALAAVVCALAAAVVLAWPGHMAVWHVALIGQAAVLVAAAWKEWRDSKDRERHTPEVADFLFTNLGGLQVTLPLLIVGLS